MKGLRYLVSTLTIVVVVAIQASDAAMDRESDRARVGQGSRSMGMTFSPRVEMAFERALAAAKARPAAQLTTEDVLVELLDEETVSELLSSARVDVSALRADLRQHLASGISSKAGDGKEPMADQALQSAMRRAVIKSLTSNEKGASGADIIVAILIEGDSYSAKILRKYGLTVESADSVRVERYLQRSKEQAKRLAEVQEKARGQRERASGNAWIDTDTAQPIFRSNAGARGTPQSGERPANRAYVLRVTSDDDEDDHIEFKAALSRNGILDLYVEETPLEIEFAASTIVGLFETVEGGDRLKVELITELDGRQTVVSGFRGSAGAIFEDGHSGHLGQRSGVLD